MHSENPPPVAREDLPVPTKRLRGFAALPAEKMQKIAALGGRAAHAAGNAHRFSADEAREAGREGGLRTSQDRAHMAEIGRRGGQQQGANRRSRRAAPELPLRLPGPSLPLLLAILLLAAPFLAGAQPMPSLPPVPASAASVLREPLLSAFGGLSDGGPVLSPYIDRFAFNARLDFLFLADSANQQQAFVLPYGFSFAVRHLVEGGIYTRYSFWKEGEHSYSYNAPLGLNLKVRLWPWFAKDPNQHSTVVAAYQHEVRTGPFDGPNQLGLRTDLAALRIAASWPLWLFDLGASAGVLYDYQGRFAVGELGARLGVRLDFISLESTRASIEGIIRGLPAYVRPDAALSGATDPQKPIPLSGALFLGINTRMTRTADFGIWAEKGFGNVASLSFGVRVLGIFIGEGYLRPRPLWAEVVKEVAAWIREQVAAIDPVFGKDCIAYDIDSKHTPMGPYGHLTDDGRFCQQNGYRVPVGVDLFRNKKGTLLCWDDKLRDCLLHRENPKAPWSAIHRPRLDSDCILKDSDGSFLERLGEPVGDGKTCLWRAKDQHGHTIDRDLEIGRLYHADRDLHRVCFNDDLTGCFVDRRKHGERWTGLQQASASTGLGIDDGVADLKKLANTAEAVASGKVNVKAITQEAAAEAEHSIERCGSEGAACAKRVFNGVVQAGQDYLQRATQFWNEPLQDKVNDTLRATGKGTLTTAPATAASIVTGGLTQSVGNAVEHRLEQAVAKQLAKQAEKGAIQRAEKQVAKKTGAAVGKAELQAAEHLPPFRPPVPAESDNLPGRRGAFRQAKRDAGIPLGQQPDAVVTPKMTDRWDNPVLDPHGRPIKTREYEFTRPDGKQIVIQDHSAGHQFGQGGVGDQGSHFNVRPAEQRRTGQLPGTQGHYSFKERQ